MSLFNLIPSLVDSSTIDTLYPVLTSDDAKLYPSVLNPNITSFGGVCKLDIKIQISP